MWKVITLSAVLSICQAADINDIYGTYTSVVLYPSEPTAVCIKLSLAEDPRKIQCSCSDGTQNTLVEMRIVERVTSSKSVSNLAPQSLPILAVDKVEDQLLLNNVTCNCAGTEYDYRGIMKVVDDNYALSYSRNGPRSRFIHNHEYLIARSLPSAAELEAAIARIGDVNIKSGSVMCTQEIYEEFKSKN